jgi:hypothetical protein
MSHNPAKLAYIASLIREAVDVNEVNEIWFSHLHEVRGTRLIYASAQPVGIVLPTSTWGMKSLTDAYPRCLYSTDNLYFMDDEIIRQYESLDKVPVSADVSIMLDSNVAGEIKRFVMNANPSNPDSLVVMDFLAGENNNFSYHQYALENARNYFMKQGHASYVRETLFYIKWFDYLDNYKSNKSKEPSIDKFSLWKEADTELFKLYGTARRRESIKGYLRMHYLIYLVLLKIVEIEFAPVKKHFDKKLEMLLDFMHEELHRIFLRELLLAVRYFKKRSEVSFMSKINKGCRSPLERLSNIAWDMMLFRVMEKFATVKTSVGFFVPYFISFDEATRELFDTYRLKGLIAYGPEGKFVSIQQSDYTKVVLDAVEDSVTRGKLSRYFEQNAIEARDQLVSRRLDSPSRQFVRQLEQKVWRECLNSPEASIS